MLGIRYCKNPEVHVCGEEFSDSLLRGSFQGKKRFLKDISFCNFWKNERMEDGAADEPFIFKGGGFEKM